jgi:hypothetical protein
MAKRTTSCQPQATMITDVYVYDDDDDDDDDG